MNGHWGSATSSRRATSTSTACSTTFRSSPTSTPIALVRGVEQNSDELDGLLRKYSEHWALERMPAVDRAVLRLGCYELAHEPTVPTAVVISEAVDLAKQYSTKDSGRFVNGLLARIAEEVRP